MLENIEAWVGFVLVSVCLSAIIAFFFIWIAAKITRMENLTFKKAILAALATAIVVYICAIIFSTIPFISPIPGFIIGLFLTLFVLKFLFKASLNHTILNWIFIIAANVISVFISAHLFIGGINDLIAII